MRDPAPFPAGVGEALPKLRLVVTTGPRDAGIAAAARRGLIVCGAGTRRSREVFRPGVVAAIAAFGPAPRSAPSLPDAEAAS
ncbi:MAG: hypothetical protein R6V44_11225 [Paracoccaceae bacterium]